MSEKVKEKVKAKAGLIPYYRHGNTVFVCMMIPSDKNFGGDELQIAKGGVDDGENALEAALREAKEELGIHSQYLVGEPVWLSKTTNKKASFEWYAVEMSAMINAPPHHETGFLSWIAIDDAVETIRDWQRPILKILYNRLISQ